MMKGQVLFVDDERSIRTITKMFLVSRGYNCLIASSGQEAIEFLNNTEYNIRIIFLDIMMPGISGFDVLKYMRQKKIKIPTIVQTGLMDQKDLGKACKLGAIDCIKKPYEMGELFKHITSYKLDKY